MSRNKYISLVGVTADDNLIVTVVKPAAGGVQSLTIAAQPPQAILIEIDCAGNDAGRTFVITGTDRFGGVITESVSGSDIGQTNSTKQFETITSITVDADTAGNIIIGHAAVVYSAWYPINAKMVESVEYDINIVETGTADWDLEYTYDELLLGGASVMGGDIEASVAVVTDPDIVGDTASIRKTLTFRAEGIRLKINSGTGSLKAHIAQAGNR